MTDIRVPTLGELVTEATVGKWFKQPGDAVAVDEPLVELETDKVTLEVPAPAAGVLGRDRGQGRRDRRGRRAARPDHGRRRRGRAESRRAGRRQAGRAAEAGASADEPRRAPAAASAMRRCRPSVRKMAAESGIEPPTVAGTGKRGQVTKGDMMAAIERAAAAPTPVPSAQMRAPVAARRCRRAKSACT